MEDVPACTGLRAAHRGNRLVSNAALRLRVLKGAVRAERTHQAKAPRGHTPRLATSVISLPSTPSGDDRASDLRPLESCLLGAEDPPMRASLVRLQARRR